MMEVEVHLEVPPPGTILVSEEDYHERIASMDRMLEFAEQALNRFRQKQKSKERFIELNRTMGESEESLAEAQKAVDESGRSLVYVEKRIHALQLTKNHVIKKFAEERPS